MGSSVITLIAQLLALFPTLIPAIQTVVTSVKDAFDSNQVVTAEDIHNIVNKAIANHAVAVSLLKPAV